MTQQQVSKKSGIAPSYLSRIENRRIEPGPKTLRRIAEALGVPVSEFFQEAPVAIENSRCAITSSGSCIMDLMRSGRGKTSRLGAESYSPQQLQLLRMANYLIQVGDHRLLSTLDLLLASLLGSQTGLKSKPSDLRRLKVPGPSAPSDELR